jgi:hypothetical protein
MQAGKTFGPEAAAILEACFATEGAAAQSELTKLYLPPELPNTFDAPQVSGLLWCKLPVLTGMQSHARAG